MKVDLGRRMNIGMQPFRQPHARSRPSVHAVGDLAQLDRWRQPLVLAPATPQPSLLAFAELVPNECQDGIHGGLFVGAHGLQFHQ